MSQTALTEPKVFISYSWTSPNHEEWVLELATRLMADGINVTLDKWDLKEGQDKFVFMESMVTSDEINKVLIICDKGYKEKADHRSGGVGTETTIITPQIYADAKQEKFIPIVCERDESGADYIPAYIASRIYIDLSSPETFEDNYDKLRRNIYQVPLHRKPALGKPPEFLFREEVSHSETTKLLREMKVAKEKYPNRLKYLLPRYLESFDESLEQYQISGLENAQELDQLIVDKIDGMRPLISEFYEMLQLITEAEAVVPERLIEFFENICKWTEFQGTGSFYEGQFDHYKFLITHLFLLTMLTLIKYEQFQPATQLLYTEYFVNTRNRGDRPYNFNVFRFYLSSLERRNQRLSLNRVSLHADLQMQFAEKDGQDLAIVDLILYYISKMQDVSFPWFPTSYIYLDEYRPIKFFRRLKSNSHFNKVKSLFNVETPEQMKRLIETFPNSDAGYHRSFSVIPNIRSLIAAEEICTLP